MNLSKDSFITVQAAGREPLEIHKNYDSVLKEAIGLYKGEALAFLGLDLPKITESLNVEFTEIEVKKSYVDLLFKLEDDTGLNLEWEAAISQDDMLRFASYNADSRRLHKMPFVTVVLTNKKPAVSYIKDETLAFTPMVINLGERDGDKLIADIKEKIAKGESVNPLEIIYAPLYNSINKSVVGLFKEAAALVPQAIKDEAEHLKIIVLSMVLTNKFVSADEMEELYMVLEELKIVKYAEEKGIEKGIEKVAKNLLNQGLDTAAIAKATGLTVEKLKELQQAI